MKNVQVKESVLANTEAHVTCHIPPYNASATTPQEAYILDQIILSGERNHLQDIYYTLQKGKAADFSIYPTFIRNRIDKLKKIEVFIQIYTFCLKDNFEVPNYCSLELLKIKLLQFFK
jgi:DNA-directed RNA polymerase I subunit RPA49